jgi:hypothetical protein
MYEKEIEEMFYGKREAFTRHSPLVMICWPAGVAFKERAALA